MPKFRQTVFNQIESNSLNRSLYLNLPEHSILTLPIIAKKTPEDLWYAIGLNAKV